MICLKPCIKRMESTLRQFRVGMLKRVVVIGCRRWSDGACFNPENHFAEGRVKENRAALLFRNTELPFAR